MLLAAMMLLSGCHSSERPAGMVLIPAGHFQMGVDHPMMPEAGPLHRVTVSAFYLDATPVTNRQFAQFVAATDYVTDAEQVPRVEDFPGVDETLLVAGSIVFEAPSQPVPLSDELQWWRYVGGANWRHPKGPQSSIDERMDHPVVQVTWRDARAFAQWAGKRLPTEAEWEYAARGKLEGEEFVWGSENPAGQAPRANIFQGSFPHANSAEDGYQGTSPVGVFAANGYGLYDMSGNVWEWVSDWYNPHAYQQRRAEGAPIINPQGPPEQQAYQGFKVQKGGSFLCTDEYCGRYRPGARGRGDPSTSSNHIGFRLAKDAES